MFNLLWKNILIILIIINVSVPGQDFDTKSRSLKTSKGGTLEINLSSGDIVINTWNKDEALVVYEDDDGGVTIKQHGNKIYISDDNWGDTDVEVTVPNQFNIDIKTSGGDIFLKDNINGEVKIFTAGGDIGLKNVQGRTSVNTSGGDIMAGDIKGDVNIRTSGGDILLGIIDGTADVTTSGGDIEIGKTFKTINVKTSGGNIILGEVLSDAKVNTAGGNIITGKTIGKVSINTAGGNIVVDGVEGKASINTAGGNIKIKNISGSLTANTSAGDIQTELNDNLSGNIDLETSYGTIRVYLSGNLQATINAQVDNDYYEENSIKSDFKPNTYNKSSSNTKAVYILNGGGKNIVNIKVSTGDIEIRKK